MLKDKVEVYKGVERVRGGAATVLIDPVQKGDRFEWNGQGYMTRLFRDDKPLFWLGQVVGWPGPTTHVVGTSLERPDAAQLDELVVHHMTVEHTPGAMPVEELARMGYERQADFNAAFTATYGAEALWRPAWRIRCGPTTHVVGTSLVRPDAAQLGVPL